MLGKEAKNEGVAVAPNDLKYTQSFTVFYISRVVKKTY